jgi:hypothetical protein
MIELTEEDIVVEVGLVGIHVVKDEDGLLLFFER